MRTLKAIIVASLFAMFAAASASAQDQAASFNARNAKVHDRPGGQALTLPSQASPPSVVADFLRGEGLSNAKVGSLVLQRQSSVARTGRTHLRFQQQVGDLTVHGAYVKATVNSDGQLIHLIEALATPGNVRPAVIGPREALDAAMAENHPGIGVIVREARRSGNRVEYTGDDFFHRDPGVTRVAIALTNGALQEGYLVETWSEDGNLLHHTLVGANGRVLKVELRTNNDSYNIFPDHPGNSNQTDTAGPGAGNAESPIGWLFAIIHKTIDIAGNNVNAYLDRDANNVPDNGGTNVSDGVFDTTADLTLQPLDSQNQNVAVQNLFYFNNIIHDKLYKHGFDEAAGNFQEDNFGNGGFGSDSVYAEAQDGGGTNNANFATPSDGFNPRMQMFLWDGAGDRLVDVTGGPTYIASGALFGGSLFNNPLTGDIAAANDGIGTTTDGCEPIGNSVGGKIALIDRGNCDFDIKVKNAQLAGAIGVIIANNQGDSLVTMGGDTVTDGVTIVIPAVFVGQSDGAELRTTLPNATLKENPEGILARDGDLDSDIIWHEYGHGLTWRMIGSMGGSMSGAIGEGMSDVLAILINNDDRVGEYSTDDPVGIRSAPYTNYPRTYGQFGGTSVHFDGEIYAATIWRLWELFQTDDISQDILFDYLIGGMNFTPSGPAFEDMRDGILAAAAGTGHECQIWQAFAAFGVGEGANYVGGSTVNESFVVPAEYSGGCTTSNTPPVTNDAIANGLEDAAWIAISLSGTDSDGGTVTHFSLARLPANGSLFTDDTLSEAAQINFDYAATAQTRTLYFVPALNFNGDATFQFAARDDGGLLDLTPATATITVAPVNDPPIAQTITDQTHPEGTFVSVDASTTDIDDATLTYSATGLPLGLGIGTNDGQITGTIDANAAQGGPLGDGVYTVEVTADDGAAQTVYPAFTWTVTDSGVDPSAPVAPTGVAALDQGDGTALISWSHVGLNVTGFEIRREKRTGKGTWKGLAIVATTDAIARSYIDASGKGTFRYQVRALNGGQTSDWAPTPTEWVPVTVTTGGGGDTGDPGPVNCKPKKNHHLPECGGSG